MISFFTAMLKSLAKPWWAWIGLLMMMNMVAPFLFLQTLEAKVVLGTFMIAAALQMSLFKIFGFVRLLGVGHLPWLALVIWLGGRLAGIGTGTWFGWWLHALVVINGLSLVMDAIDIGRYIAGERTPTYTVESA